ncbi:MAG: hypothetical protein KBB83_01575 [Alphaproteobacteria bacterium]|nr:hypothetical protein [Alphaproteobacteria bacterium]
MTKTMKLQAIMDECDFHVRQLDRAHKHLLPNFPLDHDRLHLLLGTEMHYLDQMVYRFSRLQDSLGAKLFPLLAEAFIPSQEKLTFIDMLNLLEKNEILPNAKLWREMRDFRNHLTQEYPENPDLMINNLNQAPTYVKNLLDIWVFVKPKATHILSQL